LSITSFLYRRSQIQKAAVKVWPGNQLPIFRLAENKNKLDEFAESLKEECCIPEINFSSGESESAPSVFSMKVGEPENAKR